MQIAAFVALVLVWHGIGQQAAAQSDDDKRACAVSAADGQTERDEGRLQAARRHLLACARDECPAIVRKTCAEWLAELEPRIPSIVVRVVDAANYDITDARVTLDGDTITLDGRPIALDPGPHRIVVTMPHADPVERVVLAAERDTARLVRLQLVAAGITPSPTPTRPGRDDSQPRIALGAWILGAAGVAALGGFTVLAVMAKNEHDSLQKDCDRSCPETLTHPGREEALAADISLGIGIAALVGSAAWAVLSSRNASQSTASITPLPRGVIGTLTTRF